MRLRTRVKNALQGLALAHGIRRRAGLWTRAGQATLAALPLPRYAGQRRSELQALHAHLTTLIDALDHQVSEAAQQRPQARRLMTHPGVGPVTALATEVFLGDPSRFADATALASYVGLIPSEYSSGARQRLGAVTKQGNTMLRFLWYEAAIHADSAIRMAAVSPGSRPRSAAGVGSSTTRPCHLLECIDPGRRRAPFDRFVPHGSRHDDFAEERRKNVEKADARQINERRTVSNDKHVTCLALLARNGSEFAPGVLDVGIDRVEAMLTGLDEEVVERLVERACSGGTGQPAGTHFIDDEQQPRALRQLLGWLPGRRAGNLDGDLHGRLCRL